MKEQAPTFFSQEGKFYMSHETPNETTKLVEIPTIPYDVLTTTGEEIFEAVDLEPQKVQREILIHDKPGLIDKGGVLYERSA